MPKNELAVFVYGTLKVGGYYAKHFNEYRKDVKPATVSGRMFNVNNAYPAVVLEGDNQIKGELHYYDNESEVLASMDQIEGYAGPGRPHNLYNRVEAEVVLEDGQAVIASIYVFNRPVEEFKEVAEGYWPV